MGIKKVLVISVLVIVVGLIYEQSNTNYICQQNPSHPSCQSSNNNNSSGGGSSSGGGVCKDPDVVKFLKGEDPYTNPVSGQCAAQIRQYKARINKCQSARGCLNAQVKELEQEIEALKKEKEIEITFRKCIIKCKYFLII
jgi:hypothetical protein